VSGELVKKFSKRTRLIEQLARERYTVLEAEAQDLVKKTGMDFADAFAQVKGKLGADSREAKSLASLAPEEQLANWRAQMTPEERASLKVESVKGTASQNLLEGPIAKNLSLEHLFERASVARELHAAGMLLRRGIGSGERGGSACICQQGRLFRASRIGSRYDTRSLSRRGCVSRNR